MNSRWPLLCTALLAGLLVTGSTPSRERRRDRAPASPRRRSRCAGPSRRRCSSSTRPSRRSRGPGRSCSGSRRDPRSSSAPSRAPRREAEIVRRSLAASQIRIASLLRDLYVRGEPDAIAIVFGATSLEEAMTGIDGLERATSLNERLGDAGGAEGEATGPACGRQLASRRARLDGARAEARAAEQRLARAVAAKQASVSPRSGSSAPSPRQQPAGAASAGATGAAALREDHRGDADERRLPRSAARPRPTPGAPTPATTPSPSGTRTLVVDAVAYHLPGHRPRAAFRSASA